MKRAARALLLLVPMMGCAGHKVMLSKEESMVAKGGVVLMWADWLEDDHWKFDVALNLKNDSASDLSIELGDLQCYTGDSQGEMGYPTQIMGSRPGPVITLTPGQYRSILFVCRHKEPKQGDFRVILRRVFETDRAGVKRAVVAENLELRVINDAA